MIDPTAPGTAGTPTAGAPIAGGPISATARAHPSLALVKYWGKQDGGTNIPATGSLGVSLAALSTTTTVTLADTDTDSVTINGEEQPPERFTPFFSALRETLQHAATSATRATAAAPVPPAQPQFARQIRDLRFQVESRNNFPTAAGLASSASGFAALTVATAALVERVFAGADAGVDTDAARRGRRYGCGRRESRDDRTRSALPHRAGRVRLRSAERGRRFCSLGRRGGGGAQHTAGELVA